VTTFSAKEEWARLRRPSLLKDLGGRLDKLETSLGSREWLAGAFSIADIAMVTVLRAIDDSPLVEERPSIAAYMARAVARPAFQAALDAQLAAFSETAPAVPQGA
jgi:glutathione S-transferase